MFTLVMHFSNQVHQNAEGMFIYLGWTLTQKKRAQLLQTRKYQIVWNVQQQ